MSGKRVKFYFSLVAAYMAIEKMTASGWEAGEPRPRPRGGYSVTYWYSEE